MRVFTTADGLANNRVERGAQDAHGFLWLATAEGVSRFDSRRFESFGIADGLPAAEAYDVCATSDGRVWVATDGGVAVLDPDRVVRPKFRAVTKDATFGLLVDPDGVVWAGTRRGLQRIERGVVTDVPVPSGVISIAYDPRDRSLWLGTYRGLVHRTATGELTSYRFAPPGEPDDRVFGVLVARDGTLWVAHVKSRVLALKLPLAPTESLWESPEGRHLEPEGFARRHLLEDSQGTIWIGTAQHLHRWRDGKLEKLSAQQIGAEGAPGPSVEDSAGNLWFGTDSHGVIRLAPDGLVSYDTTDGLASRLVYDFVNDGDEVYPVALGENGHTVHRWDGDHFVAVHPPLPAGSRGWGWGHRHTIVLARDRRWWWTSGDGIARYPAVARLDDLATTPGERLIAPTGADILRAYEDRRGDIWFSTGSMTGISRWNHDPDTLVALRDGWPTSFAESFAEDAAGNVWIGYSQGELVRVTDGVPERRDAFAGGEIGALLFDRAGRLWIASSTGGVVRLDDPLHPVPRHYRAAELGSNQALSIIDDLQGRIYVGTSRGIARIDPATDEIVRYGAADGLRNDTVIDSARDGHGVLWFGTKGGTATLVPRPERPVPPAQVYIMRISVAGVPQRLSPAGEQRIGPLELAHDEAAIDVELASPHFAIGRIRFQYRLSGAWSAPVEEHVLHFAQLAPGDYQLEVRVVDAHGAVSPSATVAFTVTPPVWGRWWFIAACAAAASLLAYAWYRRRLAHMLALERVRRRIATDLHDELGSSLSRIAILSEVAARKNAGAIDGQLEVIGTSARELVDVASDIVWSTDPRRDDLQSLIVRLRTFAADVLEARGIAWSVTAPTDPARIKLDPDRRRHLYLVLKEAITNAAKHSGATRVDIALRAEGSGLVATVRDDGRGFDETTLSGSGNGLQNMRARAAEARGTLDIRVDRGTEIVLRV